MSSSSNRPVPATWRSFDSPSGSSRGEKSKSLDLRTITQSFEEYNQVQQHQRPFSDNQQMLMSSSSSSTPHSFSAPVTPVKSVQALNKEALGSLQQKFRQKQAELTYGLPQSPSKGSDTSHLSDQSPCGDSPAAAISSAASTTTAFPDNSNNELMRQHYLALPHVVAHLQGLLLSPSRLKHEADVTNMLTQCLQSLAFYSLRAAPQSLPSVMDDIVTSTNPSTIRDAVYVLALACAEPDARTIALEHRAAILKLSELMATHQDEKIKKYAALAVGNIATEEVGGAAVLRSSVPIIHTLLSLLQSTDTETQRNAMFALQQLSLHRSVLETLVANSEVIPKIEILIDSSDKIMAKFAAKILHNIVSFHRKFATREIYERA